MSTFLLAGPAPPGPPPLWQETHEESLNTGPRPSPPWLLGSAGVHSRRNSSRPRRGGRLGEHRRPRVVVPIPAKARPRTSARRPGSRSRSAVFMVDSRGMRQGLRFHRLNGGSLATSRPPCPGKKFGPEIRVPARRDQEVTTLSFSVGRVAPDGRGLRRLLLAGAADRHGVDGGGGVGVDVDGEADVVVPDAPLDDRGRGGARADHARRAGRHVDVVDEVVVPLAAVGREVVDVIAVDLSRRSRSRLDRVVPGPSRIPG